MNWPPENTVPTSESPWYCDGQLIRGRVLQVTAKGVVYGQTHWVALDDHKLWWTGSGYRYVDTVDEVMSVQQLPPGPRPFGEMWAVRTYDPAKNDYYWAEYWWDAEAGLWKKLKWLWTIDGFANLPRPGLEVGAAHIVIERDIEYYFDGENFQRKKHSALDDDEPLRHLPAGFLTSLQPDARLEYYSPTEIAIESIPGGSGKVLVNLEYVNARREASVFPRLPVLQWDEGAGTITPVYIEPNTEYVIYLANSDTAFSVGALPGDATHAATAAWDFRTKLFLSTNEAHNGYLGARGAGLNARRAGKIETDNTPASEGGPYFLREIDISDISRQVSLPETYREFSDFTVIFVDENTIALQKIDGTFGQIYVGGKLQRLGSGYQLSRNDPWIAWIEQSGATRIERRTDALTPSSQYYLYIAGDVDSYNFNPLNPDTNRPWQATDAGASTHYDAAKDMRLRMFLSSKEPDHGFLDETWPGYQARHVGQIKTDASGRFVNAWDLSAIRQAALNPSWFDGLAEIEITPIDTTEVRVCKKKGSSGIVIVRGSVVQMYEKDDPDVHRFTTADIVQAYTEASPSAPLTDMLPVPSYAGQEIHLYLANGRAHWGQFANRLFFSTTPPSAGYLSCNWPGNTARWICTVKPDSLGEFSGPYIAGTISISAHSQLFDDEPEKHRLINDHDVSITNLLSAVGVLFQIQKVQGLPVRLSRVDETHVKVAPIGDQPATLVLPDLSTVSVPAAGLTAAATGSTNATYYVWLDAAGLTISTEVPTATYANLAINGNRVLVGWLAFAPTNMLAGDWNVWSFSHEKDLEFSTAIASETTALNLPGCIIPPGKTAKLHRTGQDSAGGAAFDPNFYNGVSYGSSGTIVTGAVTLTESFSSGGMTRTYTVTATATLSDDTIASGIRNSFALTHTISGGAWYSFSGRLILTRNP